MREIIAVCRSEKHARDHVARVLDRNFWRIGDRTWRDKTRTAPTILANAAMGDARLDRRYFRMTLGLGLRVLATQSGRIMSMIWCFRRATLR